LRSAVTGAGLGAATGAGATAAWHMVPEMFGGKPDSTNNIIAKTGPVAQAAVAVKDIADVAPVAAGGIGAVKDWNESVVSRNYLKNLNRDDYIASSSNIVVSV